MKYKPLLGDQLSGSLGGVTASHNRGGTYFRQRAIPVNPGTPFQSAVRGVFAQLTSLWLNTLTAAQRAAWDTYALNVPLPDALGDPHNKGGLPMYVRSNAPRLQAGATRIDDAPTIYNLGDFTPVSATLTAPTSWSVTFTTGDAWVSEDDAHMLILGSRGLNPSRNYFKGPYRFAGSIDGDSGTPPTSPAAITSPFPFSATQAGFLQVAVSRADGRLSTPQRFRAIAS